MIVITIDSAPKMLRGELTRWFLEVKPGVFVGNVNKRIRELLWERLCVSGDVKGAMLIYSSNNEQGYCIEITGSPNKSIADFDGLQLIKTEKH